MPQPEIKVESWAGLARAPHALDDVGAQVAETFRFAREWVARPDGFRPSPVCLLRPLGEVMELLAGVLASMSDVVETDLAGLADAVASASAGLQDRDVAVALGLPEVA